MPQSTDTTLSSAVSQNSLNLIKPFSAEAPVNKGNPGAAVRAQTSESTVELSSVKRQQVDTANAFLKELQGARSVFQAATSAFQEIRPLLLGEGGPASDDTLKKAGDKSLRLLSELANVRAEQELADVQRRLANSDTANFTDVVEAVAVLAKVAKQGLDGAGQTELKQLAQAVSLVNEALNKAQTRLEKLTSTVSAASSKAEADLGTREGLERVLGKLGESMQGQRDSALKAQANVNADMVARMLKDSDAGGA
ncbi:hypothetical protein NQT62_13900 [Limnobacter humi]|uniref:Toxic anion resistance protein n=1 Tax=Limnobacter humi TaxID=1778671 RepID=A0ABT1WJ44_9BURK|nr:hypothetical protein [Limnobacter humi]MCQ8897530.1 hypothetical protein [Limnobacter humi]